MRRVKLNGHQGASMSLGTLQRWAKWGLSVSLLALAAAPRGSALQRTTGSGSGSGSGSGTTTQQSPSTTDYSAAHPGSSISADPFDGRNGSRELEERRSKLMNSERQKMMVKEAAQLVQMTADLQFSLSQKPGGTSSELALKQVDTVEKLARNVKERMKGGR